VVGIGLKSENIAEVKESLLELEELALTSGYELVGSATQFVEKYNPATLLGKGKVTEIGDMARECQAQVVLVDHQISGVQTRNLEKEWGCRVFDRNQIILEIFAARAQTYEGKLQVELARLLDTMPRMVDMWMGSLSRQGGGIGTRGPGEKAIEHDRRVVRKQIVQIKKKLEAVRSQREQRRAARKKQKIPTFALIGYTNSGKSCLLNNLTKSNVFSKDLLFATLDPTTRKCHLSTEQSALVTDTVGFIRKLPHHLIDAFKATLEESASADILIHVVDLSNPQVEKQVEVVDELIKQFNWGDKPVIHAYNKIDIAPFQKRFHAKGENRVFISAQTGEGLEQLKTIMKRAIEQLAVKVDLFIPSQEKGRIFELTHDAKNLVQEESPAGINCQVYMMPSLIFKWRKYIQHY
jgi:GTP-binding protein HflX